MAAPTKTPSRRFEIRPGALVMSGDDEIGKVERAIVSPGTGEVTGLVVRKGLILRRDIVIPIEAVEEATEEVVQVRLSPDELNRLPEYHDEEFINPPNDWRSPEGEGPGGFLFRLPSLPTRRGLRSARAGQTEVSAGGWPIRAGMPVIGRDGEVGKLDLVLLDPKTNRATHFVVRTDGLLGKDTIVPVDWVQRITRDALYLDVSSEQLDRLPEYRSDDEITDDVLDTLWYRSNYDPEDLLYLEVNTVDGIVELRGLTTDDRTRRLIERTVRKVPGVLGVRNRVRTFEELAEQSRRWRRGHERSSSRPAPSHRRAG